MTRYNPITLFGPDNPDPDSLIDDSNKILSTSIIFTGKNLYTDANYVQGDNKVIGSHNAMLRKDNSLWEELFPNGTTRSKSEAFFLRDLLQRTFLLGRIGEYKGSKYVAFWNAKSSKKTGALLKDCLRELLTRKLITLDTIVSGDVKPMTVNDALGGTVSKGVNIDKRLKLHLNKTKEDMGRLGLATGGKVASTWRGQGERLGVNIADWNLNFRDYLEVDQAIDANPTMAAKPPATLVNPLKIPASPFNVSSKFVTNPNRAVGLSGAGKPLTNPPTGPMGSAEKGVHLKIPPQGNHLRIDNNKLKF